MYDQELLFAKNLAKKATATAMEYFGTDLEVENKSDDSPVTIADQTINKMVIEAVKETYPEHGILGEEESWHPDRQTIWICDPIDGTVSFTMGEPTFMFALALVVNGSVVLSVVADPVQENIYSAVKGQGAYKNDEKISVSQRTYEESWVVLPTNLKTLIKHKDIYVPLTDNAEQSNAIHGSVFKAILVAQGLCDVTVWFESVKPWDAAAASLIVEEAGGTVTDTNNKEYTYNTELANGLVMSNTVLHNQVIDLIHQ